MLLSSAEQAGKTLTTSPHRSIIKTKKYPNILTNPTGANLTQRIVFSFEITRQSWRRKNIAVLEVVKQRFVTLLHISNQKIICLHEYFRDQWIVWRNLYNFSINTWVLLLHQVLTLVILANGDALFLIALILKSTWYFGWQC